MKFSLLEYYFNNITIYADRLSIGMIGPLAVVFFIFGLDDFIIDLCAYLFRLKPKELSPKELSAIEKLPEKRIAVLIAAWKEDGVIKQMIRGNLASINYCNYSVFIGVYPNDLATLKEAQELSFQNEFVHIIVNPLNGPTCKGQMLNVLVKEILKSSKMLGIHYDAFVVHDCEDLIHKEEFKIANRDLHYYDFIQFPVFSLPVSPFAWVAGIYIDEFSEAHVKAVLVRNRLGVPIPSAGVGVVVSKRFVLACMEKQEGNFMTTKSLTEDYELGLSTHELGFLPKFACYYIKNTQPKKSKRDYVATREYFPKSFRTSVRQKSRWTLGIAFQGWENLGWNGSWLHKYFLFRDRKGPLCNILLVFALSVFLYALFREQLRTGFFKVLFHNTQLCILMQINILFMINRLASRMWCVYSLYGWKIAIFAPVRWPLANMINFLAAAKAIVQYVESKIYGTVPKWIKTEHELPEGFGLSNEVAMSVTHGVASEVVKMITNQAAKDQADTLV